MMRRDLLALFVLSVFFQFFTAVKCSKKIRKLNEELVDMTNVTMSELLALTVPDLQKRFFYNLKISNTEAYESLIDAIITLKGDINEIYNGHPLLIHSINLAQMSAVKILLDNGANVNVTDDDGRTALYHAINLSESEIADFLINNGADLNSEANMLVVAAKDSSCSVDFFKKLLSSGLFDVNFIDPENDDFTALNFACKNGHYEFFRLLLDYGADIFMGTNPLIDAVLHGHADIVHDLLELEADYSCAEDEETLLHLVFYGKETERARIVRYLLECGLEVDARNDYDQTPLLLALQSEMHPDIIRTLINNGADTSIKVSLGMSAFSSAIVFRSDLTENIRVLMNSAPDVNVFDNDEGRSAIHYAVEANNVHLIAYLLGQGVDVNLKNAKGLTPLNIASSHKFVEIEKYLIENGAEAAVQNLQESS